MGNPRRAGLQGFLVVAAATLMMAAAAPRTAHAQEPFKGPLDPVTTAFRDAATKLSHAPAGTDPSKLLKQTVAPAISERAHANQKKRGSQLASWHLHRASGEAGAPQNSSALREDEVVLSGEGIPAVVEFSGPKKTKKTPPALAKGLK
jgi:hypothetical protein